MVYTECSTTTRGLRHPRSGHAQVYTPPGFKIHGVPFVCGFAIFGAFFLIASLGQEAVLRFFIVLICISFLYLLYGVHAAEAHDTDVDAARAYAALLPMFW